MADPKPPTPEQTSVQNLEKFLEQKLLEWDPSLKNDPIKMKELVTGVVQDFYAVAQTNPQLIKLSVTQLEPLLQFLTAKRLDLHTSPHLKPMPMRTIGKKCDELIQEICKDDPGLRQQLKDMVNHNMKETLNPEQPNPKATGILMNLFMLLKLVKNGNKANLKPLQDFAELSEADRSNIMEYGQKPDSPGSNVMTITQTKCSLIVVQSLSNAALLKTVAAKMEAYNQPIDEADEIKKQNDEVQKYKTPFDGAKKLTPFDQTK